MLSIQHSLACAKPLNLTATKVTASESSGVIGLLDGFSFSFDSFVLPFRFILSFKEPFLDGVSSDSFVQTFKF